MNTQPLAALPDGRSRAIGAPALLLMLAALAFVIIGALAAPEQAEAIRPSRDEQVLAHVAKRSTSAGQKLAQLRAASRASPRDLEPALSLARAHIEASREEGDPRPLGYAEGVLAPFLQGDEPSSEALVLRATILQSRHAFEPALRDLTVVLTREPQHAQALLTEATVLTVLGRYAEARTSCERLAQVLPAPWPATCLAPVDALSGHAERARSTLDGELVRTTAPEQQAFLHSLRGELSFWLNDLTVAEEHLTRAVALDASDRYSRALYADVLLEQGRKREALRFSEPHLNDDAMLLRAALAADALGDARAADLAERARAAFSAGLRRGERVHQRELARLLLASGDAKRALSLALEGFAVQREAWDMRLVLESARAAGQPERAQPVLSFIAQNHTDLPMLAARADELRSSP